LLLIVYDEYGRRLNVENGTRSAVAFFFVLKKKFKSQEHLTAAGIDQNLEFISYLHF
jgi:hypothetical protein